MHAFARVRLAPIALLAIAILVAMPSASFAAQPSFHDNSTFTVPGINICGVDGDSTIHVNNVVTFGDTNFKVTGSYTENFVAVDGRSATLHSAGSTTGTMTDNGDGTLTFVTTYKGLPEQIRGGGGGVSTRDAGLISFIATVDATTGDLISSSVIEHGPHPEADADFSIFCDAFLAALG